MIMIMAKGAIISLWIYTCGENKNINNNDDVALGSKFAYLINIAELVWTIISFDGG